MSLFSSDYLISGENEIKKMERNKTISIFKIQHASAFIFGFNWTISLRNLSKNVKTPSVKSTFLVIVEKKISPIKHFCFFTLRNKRYHRPFL